jgi:hypothetical protein
MSAATRSAAQRIRSRKSAEYGPAAGGPGREAETEFEAPITEQI